MPLSLRLAFLLLLPALALTACGGEDDAEVTISEEPSDISDPDLLGYWVVTRENGEMPTNDQEVRIQFTAQGDFIRYVGSQVERLRYTFASESQLMIDGPDGPTLYDYRLDGDELTLTEPGEDGTALSLRKLADVDLENVPPPASVPEEDALPTDSVPPAPAPAAAPAAAPADTTR